MTAWWVQFLVWGLMTIWLVGLGIVIGATVAGLVMAEPDKPRPPFPRFPGMS